MIQRRRCVDGEMPARLSPEIETYTNGNEEGDGSMRDVSEQDIY
jgi:hypothetical protein